jgi:hypothetical protein
LLGGDAAGLVGADALEDGDEVALFGGGAQVRGQVAGGIGLCDAGGHRSARDEDGGDVDAQGAHEHAGDDLVAIRDADHAVEAVGAQDGLDAVGDELARRQGELHAGVAHGDAVIDADGVEHEGDAAGLADEALDELADLVEVRVAGDAVDVAVGDGDERLVEIGLGFDHAGGAEEAAVGGAFKALLDGIGAHV